MTSRHFCRALLIAGCSLFLPFILVGESITVVRTPPSFLGPADFEPGEYFVEILSYDSENQEESNAQRLTTRYPGSFRSFARNSEGTLFGMLEEGRLVEIDETTGFTTDGVTISDPDAMDDYYMGPPIEISVRAPAIAFVPGEMGDTLYAIINREPFRGFEGALAPPVDVIETGFLLVTIDMETGVVTETGIALDGQHTGGGHGLEYDPDLGALVYFFYDEAEGDEPSSFATIAVIDPVAETVSLANQSPIAEQGYPSSFTGVVGFGNGMFVTSDNRGSGFYEVTVIDEGMGDYSFTIFETEPEGGYPYGVRALDRTAEGNLLLAEIDGFLTLLNLDGSYTDDAPVELSVGGYPLEITSVASHPTSGQIIAIGSGDRLKRRPRTGDVDYWESRYGLFSINRSSPSPLEFTDPFVQLKSVEEGVAEVENICFGPGGSLWGVTDYMRRGLVQIDAQTGLVDFAIDLEELLPRYTGNYQLAYHPDEKAFYLLFFEADEIYEPILVKIGLDGSLTPIALQGDFPSSNPRGLAYVGNDTFIFSLSFFAGGDLICSLTTGGLVEVLALPEESDFLLPPDVEMEILPTHSLGSSLGLTQAGPFGLADISIGTSPRRLIGNNRYSRAGRGQRAVLRKVTRRFSGQYFYRIENDGAYSAPIALRGTTRARNAAYTYLAQGAGNVTALIRRGATADFDANTHSNVTVRFRARGNGRVFRANTFASASSAFVSDLGKVSTTLIKPRRRRPSSGPKPSSLF